MTEDFAINILEQYREKPTLINEIETVEEAIWLDEALDMAIKAIKAFNKIRNEFIDRYPHNYANKLELGGRNCVFSLNEILQIIDKYKIESEK